VLCVYAGAAAVTGSRAVVLECQFGPRRKNHTRKTAKASFDTSSSSGVFRHSCPAR